ncbi:flagellar hook assembly protein FlgD [Pseudohongiella sp. SYSU M77423]|uniref:flagellar hook assembly protein FlgD n=1 Tax=Pseudohongiella sp. SYSU M77423 TaxID=3042312 RepID=UPI00247FE2BB|nr:flagellar hook assembly protein FlgD [Pseudohongiella sp. SYSU M77423]MDH7944876.1 flagellar hook assembly protein FlgD [Pseudohongiella sp. SYSU M77423]
MMEINGAGGNALSKILSDYGNQEEKKTKNEMGRDEFLRLLIAQLENQDPTNPQDNGEFISQLAQFSSLEEAQKMTQSFEQFSSAFQSAQHLQATSLVGRPVHVKTNTTQLGESGAISVLADFDGGAQSATLRVYDASGKVVDQFGLGEQTDGRQEFFWTGTDANDERYPPGKYSFELSVSRNGITEQVPTYLSANVNSVTIEKSGSLTLNLAGVGPVSMSEILQIN